MTITEFHQLSVAALAAEPDEETLIDLAKEAQQLADMVGWADGIIDKEGRVSEALFWLQKQAVKKHKATDDQNVAILHDAIGELIAAVFRHDEDLDLSSESDDDSGVV